MENVDPQETFSYFNRINPKPDLYILKSTAYDTIKKYHSFDKKYSFPHCKKAHCVLIHKKAKLKLIKENCKCEWNYMAMCFECQSVEGKLQFTVIVNLGAATTYCFQENFNADPILLAGKYDSDLLKYEAKIETHDFVMAKYNPTMYKMITAHMGKGQHHNFFACRNGAEMAIKLHDVRAEMTSSLLNVMDGPDTVNHDLLMMAERVLPIGEALQATLSFEHR